MLILEKTNNIVIYDSKITSKYNKDIQLSNCINLVENIKQADKPQGNLKICFINPPFNKIKHKNINKCYITENENNIYEYYNGSFIKKNTKKYNKIISFCRCPTYYMYGDNETRTDELILLCQYLTTEDSHIYICIEDFDLLDAIEFFYPNIFNKYYDISSQIFKIQILTDQKIGDNCRISCYFDCHNFYIFYVDCDLRLRVLGFSNCCVDIYMFFDSPEIKKFYITNIGDLIYLSYDGIYICNEYNLSSEKTFDKCFLPVKLIENFDIHDFNYVYSNSLQCYLITFLCNDGSFGIACKNSLYKISHPEIHFVEYQCYFENLLENVPFLLRISLLSSDNVIYTKILTQDLFFPKETPLKIQFLSDCQVINFNDKISFSHFDYTKRIKSSESFV